MDILFVKVGDRIAFQGCDGVVSEIMRDAQTGRPRMVEIMWERGIPAAAGWYPPKDLKRMYLRKGA